MRKEVIDALGVIDDSTNSARELKQLVGEVFEVYEHDDRDPSLCLAALHAVAGAFVTGEAFQMELSNDGMDDAEVVEAFVMLARRAAIKALR